MKVLIAKIRLVECPEGDVEDVALVSPELDQELGDDELYNAFISVVDAPVFATEGDAMTYARDRARELGCRDTRVRFVRPSRSTALRLAKLLNEVRKGRSIHELAKEFRSLAIAIHRAR